MSMDVFGQAKRGQFSARLERGVVAERIAALWENGGYFMCRRGVWSSPLTFGSTEHPARN